MRGGPRGVVSASQTDLSEEVNYNMAASSSSSPPSSYVPSPVMQTPIQIKRRSSHDVLLSLAGPDSGLPLPKQRDPLEENGIREGVPVESFKRSPSPSKSSAFIVFYLPYMEFLNNLKGYPFLQLVSLESLFISAACLMIFVQAMRVHWRTRARQLRLAHHDPSLGSYRHH